MQRRRELMGMQEKENINIWNERWENGYFNTTNGSNIANADQIRNVGYISVKPSTKYYFYAGKGSQWAMFFDSEKNAIPINDYPIDELKTRSANVYAIRSNEFTTPPICKYMRFYCTAGYGTEYLNDISINYPATDHEYHKHI